MKVTQLRKGVTWSLQVVLAMLLLTVGMAKVSGVQSSVELFGRLGFGQWFRYATGLIEVTSAVLILFGPYASLGAGIALSVMVGAVMAHLWLIGGSVLPALGIGALAGLVIYMRRQVRRAEELQEFRDRNHRKTA